MQTITDETLQKWVDKLADMLCLLQGAKAIAKNFDYGKVIKES